MTKNLIGKKRPFTIGYRNSLGRLGNKAKIMRRPELTDECYPFVIHGDDGGKRRIYTNGLAAKNLEQKAPFIFVDGSGSSSNYWHLQEAATVLGCSDDLYVINALSSWESTPDGLKTTHTFDPLNALIGNSYAFGVLFDNFGEVIHSLCASRKSKGLKVELIDLSNYTSLEWLKSVVNDPDYSQAHDVIKKYIDLGHEEETHMLCTAKAREFLEIFGVLGCYSSSPEIDFDEIYKQKKFLVVMLPFLAHDRDSLKCLENTILLLMAQSRKFQPQDDHPTEYLYDVEESYLHLHLTTVFNHPSNMVVSVRSPRSEEDRNYLNWTLSLAKSSLALHCSAFSPSLQKFMGKLKLPPLGIKKCLETSFFLFSELETPPPIDEARLSRVRLLAPSGDDL